MSEISAAQPAYSSATETSGALVSSGFGSNPWVQLIFGVVCMAMVANLQYGWTIFVNPIDARYHWGKAAIQVAFTLFILLETWLVPFEAYLADRFGPRPLVMVGAVSDRALLDYLFTRGNAQHALRGRGNRRHRNGPGVWDVHRECG